MTHRQSLLSSLMLGAALIFTPAVAAEESMTFTAQSGESVEAFQGSFEVPENRADPDSRMITISYVRFPATGEVSGPPIVYLAGGPGGSGTGTARAQRFPLFMSMRQHGDVIAFDQRGTGGSQRLPRCTSSLDESESILLGDEAYAAAYRTAVVECGAFWRGEGVDLMGYRTTDSVADLSDLRRHLGADQMTLWGISYGSHLAFAALNEIPDEINRVVIASAEGLDQTVKMPAQTDAYFARLQAAVDSQPAAAAAYPDIAGMMRRVHAQLEAEPLSVDLPQEDGSVVTMPIGRITAQRVASGLISDPQYAALLLMLYSGLEAGDTTLLTILLQRFGVSGGPTSMSAMPTAMDIASGVSDARLAAYEEQAETALIGRYLNFPMPQALGAWDDFDLGEEFRAAPTGDTPLLLLSGTLDGRTYPESQAEAVSGLSDVTIVTIRNAGHNLFMSGHETHNLIHQFMRGEAVEDQEIEIELPDLTAFPSLGG
jgi:pimeloyl-ACP methyl ester carboxylesterase